MAASPVRWWRARSASGSGPLRRAAARQESWRGGTNPWEMKVCPWLLFLALLAGLGTGCSTGPAPRPTTVQVLPGHHLGFVPPAGWKAEGDHAWVRSHEGRLSVQVFGPDPRQEAVDQLTRALDLLARDSAAATGSLVRFPPRSFEYDPDREALVALCTRVRQANTCWRGASSPSWTEIVSSCGRCRR